MAPHPCGDSPEHRHTNGQDVEGEVEGMHSFSAQGSVLPLSELEFGRSVATPCGSRQHTESLSRLRQHSTPRRLPPGKVAGTDHTRRTEGGSSGDEILRRDHSGTGASKVVRIHSLLLGKERVPRRSLARKVSEASTEVPGSSSGSAGRNGLRLCYHTALSDLRLVGPCAVVRNFAVL